MEGENHPIPDPVGRLEIIEKESPNRGPKSRAHTISLHSHFLAYYYLNPGKQLTIGRDISWQEIDMYHVGILLT